MFYEKVVFRNFARFTGKHLCQSLLFDKVACLRRITLLKKRLWHRCFPVNLAKFLRTPLDDCFFIEILKINTRIRCKYSLTTLVWKISCLAYLILKPAWSQHCLSLLSLLLLLIDYTFFYKQCFFTTQHLCCLTFTWILH